MSKKTENDPAPANEAEHAAAPMSRREKIAWVVMGVFAALFLAVALTANWRAGRRLEAGLRTAHWDLWTTLSTRDARDVPGRDDIVLIGGSDVFTDLANYTGSEPEKALALVRDGLRDAGDPNRVLTAANLAAIMPADDLVAADLEQLVRLAQPLPKDLKAIEDDDAAWNKRSVGEKTAILDRLVVNKIALNLLERMILVEKSAGDGHLAGRRPVESDEGTVDFEPVLGTFVPRDGIDSAVRGNVRFGKPSRNREYFITDMGAQAEYFAAHYAELVRDGKRMRKVETPPGAQVRALAYFVLPNTATEGGADAVAKLREKADADAGSEIAPVPPAPDAPPPVDTAILRPGFREDGTPVSAP